LFFIGVLGTNDIVYVVIAPFVLLACVTETLSMGCKESIITQKI